MTEARDPGHGNSVPSCDHGARDDEHERLRTCSLHVTPSSELTASGCNASENALVTVIGIFGPTASGKSGVAEEVGRADSGGARVRRRHAGLPRPADPHEPVEPDAARRRSGRSTRRPRSASTRRSPTPRSTRSSRAGRTPVVVGGTGLYLRAALAELSLPPKPLPGARERWAPLYDERRGRRARRARASSIPAAAAAVHPNDRRRVVRALELAEAGSSLAPATTALVGGTRGTRP